MGFYMENKSRVNLLDGQIRSTPPGSGTHNMKGKRFLKKFRSINKYIRFYSPSYINKKLFMNSCLNRKFS